MRCASRPAGTFLVVATVVLVGVAGALGCGTVPVVTPGLAGVDRVALVSAHARRDITMQDQRLVPMLLPAGLGEEALDMIVADVEGELEDRFGVGAVVPHGVAIDAAGYDALPEAVPPDEWSQVDRMIAVDVDAPETPARLGAIARALGVDAAIVVRHEWWVGRTRYDRLVNVVGFDRCTLLVVDRAGAVLWRDTVVAQQGRPVTWGTLAPDFGAQPWGEAALQLARLTARQAWQELRARERSARPTARAPAPPPG